MKQLLTLFMLLSASQMLAQTVHPTGAPVVTVNWNTMSPTLDSLKLDFDGDRTIDAVIWNRNFSWYFPGDSPGAQCHFMARSGNAYTYLATDSITPAYAAYFNQGDLARRGLIWNNEARGPGFTLDYTPRGAIGPPASVGYGNFYLRAYGYLVFRKQIPGTNTWRYWWVHATRPAGNFLGQVDFWGGDVTTPLGTAAGLPPLAYPNPSADGWQLPLGTRGSFRLFDCLGRLQNQGLLQPTWPNIEGRLLSPGFYLLEYRDEQGALSRQRLTKL